jgi:hypothetical protein
MSFPRFLASALALFGFLTFAAADTESPSAKDSPATGEKPARVTPRPLKRLSDPYARLPEVRIVPGALPAPAAAPENKGLFILPKMIVNGEKGKAPGLPRIFVQPPARKGEEPADPNWETPEGRAARLVRKHITSLDKTLNGHALPLIGTTIEAKAKQAEAREAAATQLNSIADLLELSAQLGLDDPAAQKKLRAEYQNALLDRPR